MNEGKCLTPSQIIEFELYLEFGQIIEVVNRSSVVNRLYEFSAVNSNDINRLALVPLPIYALKYRHERHALF